MFVIGSAEDAQAGYFEGEIQLASEAPLGQWQIEVTSPQEETTSKSFSVEEYGMSNTLMPLTEQSKLNGGIHSTES